jgi:glutamate decarboxylase
MSLKSRALDAEESDVVEANPIFTRPGEDTLLSRYSIPDHESAPETAYQIVHDEAPVPGSHTDRTADTWEPTTVDNPEIAASNR